MFHIDMLIISCPHRQAIWRLSRYKNVVSIGIPMLQIRQSRDHYIFNMGIPIPGKDNLYIDTGPGCLFCIEFTMLYYTTNRQHQYFPAIIEGTVTCVIYVKASTHEGHLLYLGCCQNVVDHVISPFWHKMIFC